MQRSTTRILTTHAGSLPRPRELTRLYALSARGEAVDASAVDRVGRDAVRAVVRKQHDAGIDGDAARPLGVETRQRGRPRQAAGMGGQDPLRAAQHMLQYRTDGIQAPVGSL